MINLTSIILFLALMVYPQAEKEHYIYWHEGHELSWEDFQGRHIPGHSHDAQTNWGISYSFGMQNNQLKFTVKCTFDRNTSWVKPNKKTQQILEHEQVHFDLAEVYARKLRRKLLETDYQMATLEQQVKSVYKEVFQACIDEQEKYDKETNHSENRDKQVEWNKKVEKELKQLQKYSELNYSLDIDS